MASTTVCALLWLVGLTAGASVNGTRPRASTTPPSTTMTKKYYVNTFLQETWHGAYTQCQRNNSQLARVDSKEENKQVVDLIQSLPPSDIGYWIGGNDLATEGEFTWLYTGEPLEYTNWHDGEPINNWPTGEEDCVSYSSDGLDEGYHWIDESCDDVLFFVCEYFVNVTKVADAVDWRSGHSS